MHTHQTVLISGASSGIGAACVSLCLEKGYKVIGIARDFEKLNITEPHFYPVICDLKKPQLIEKTLKIIIKEHTPDHFIHSAGFGQFAALEQFSSAQVLDMIQVNLSSAILISKFLLPTLRKSGNSKMIFIGSESAVTAGKQGSVYCASKFGLRGFTQALRQDCATDNVAVSLVNPGMVNSPFFDALNFRPKMGESYSIHPAQIAEIVLNLLISPSNLVVDEINCSPAIKCIDFSKKAE